MTLFLGHEGYCPLKESQPYLSMSFFQKEAMQGGVGELI